MNIEGNGYVAKRYQQLQSERDPFLQRARDASELTIPYIMPPEGHSASTVYKTPFQGIGARGVNNLASKLLLSLLPPNEPFFRLMIDDFELASLGDASRGAAEEALGRIERAALQEIEAQAVRVPVFEALKQLIVTGNALVYLPKKEGMKVFRLDRYVVERDAMGNVLEVITKETVSPTMLPDSVKEMLEKGENTEESSFRNLDLYTYVCLKGKKWEVYQEVQGMEVPGSRGSYAMDKSPFIPLRFSRIDGEAYGRGFVEEYIGDLKSLESLTQAIVEGSAASAKVLFLVRPNGTTKARALAESPNGAIVNGDANDVTTLQVQKSGDFSVALQSVQAITERLSFAFLLNSSVQRQAERVTAEEVRYMAQELESALGGVYSILSQEFQMPLINLLLYRMESAGKMPKMPKDTVKPTIVTGMEALGRGQDLNKLATFLQYLQPLGAELIQQELNVGDYIDRLGASLGIDTQGLIKSDEQKAEEQQAAQQDQQNMMQQGMMADMASKATTPMVKGAYDQAAQGNVDPEMIKQAMAAMQQQ
jgi:hypothetical protein